MEVVLASSSVESNIGCWDLQTGAEQLRYKSCASPSHGLVCVSERFLASSQLRDSSSANSGYVLYWSWSKTQPEIKSFPAEPIKPLAADKSGVYLAGGGSSGHIYFWEVETGRLLKKWHAHYRAVTCLLFSEDDSLLISGSEDGSVRVWSLLMIFDDLWGQEANHLHSFSEHTLCVTDIAIGYGGCNATIVSSSEDRTCKVWSLSSGKLLRNIIFPSIIDAIALDPAEHVFFAGSRDGKIFIAALNAESISSHKYGMHILGSFSNHRLEKTLFLHGADTHTSDIMSIHAQLKRRGQAGGFVTTNDYMLNKFDLVGSISHGFIKAVTCLAYAACGNLLLSGSEDGMVRVWNANTRNIVRMFKHAKGPINNIIIVREQLDLSHFTSHDLQASKVKQLLPPPLEKYANSNYEETEVSTLVSLCGGINSPDALYISHDVMSNQIKELQDQGSAATTEMEVGRLKLDYKKSMQMVNQWKKMYENLHQFCVNELLDSDQAGTSDKNCT